MRASTIVWGLAACGLLGTSSGATVTQLEFLGEARIPGGSRFADTVVGGLSGITYDSDHGVYHVVVDDPSARDTARFYTLEIDLEEGRLTAGGAEVVGMTIIRSPNGDPMPRLTLDPEGIAHVPDGSFYISSEGQIERQVAPFVRQYGRDGAYLGELLLPERYWPDPENSRGPRHNRVFESLTATADGSHLFTAVENALLQDGPAATLEAASPSRLLRFDLGGRSLVAEYLYWTEPVAEPASVPDGMEVTGLVELLALSDRTLLAMERSFSIGAGNTIQLFFIDLEGATNLLDIPALGEVSLGEIVPVAKDPVLNLSELGIYLDNLEGMTFGPDLQDGRRLLILVSDDNFNPLVQTTQVLAFAVGDDPLDIETVQGAGHRSPLDGQWVRDIEGIVTAVVEDGHTGLWMESPTGDELVATSQGILVLLEEGQAAAPGQRLMVDGRVVEKQRPDELSLTTIQASRVQVVAGQGEPLGPPVRVGGMGRAVPAEVADDDGLRVFEPRFDGLDFWESLEGMRVTVTRPRVTGPSSRYGDLVVDVAGAPGVGEATATGSLILRPGDANPERLTVDLGGFEDPPAIDVGAVIAGDLTGVVGYEWGTYRLYPGTSLPKVVPARIEPEVTAVVPGEQTLTVATLNVLNLSAHSEEDKFAALARTLTTSLGGPDIVALQEIQDDSGSADDGTVSAVATLERLIEAVRVNGGPLYEHQQIDPVDNADGGRPGSNIRVAFLFNPVRVGFDVLGRAGPLDSVRPVVGTDGVELSLSPGRIRPRAPAFYGDDARGFGGSRKPLVGQFRFGRQRLFVINNHWSSKGPDTGTFGALQPPVRHSEDQRAQQALLVAEFVGEILALDPDAGIVVLGDLNEHEFRAPLRVLTGAPLHNLVERLSPGDRYSFNYRGNSQLLDHILVSQHFLERAQVRIDAVHVNADFAYGRGSSDHDPLVVGITFSAGD